MDLILPKSGADVTVLVWVESSSTPGTGLTGLAYNTGSLVCYYARPGAAAVEITLADQTVAGAHTDGGFKEIDATNLPGLYRLDLPDAVCASGVDSAVVMLQGAANMYPARLDVRLTDYELAALGKAEVAAALHDQAISAASAWTGNSVLDRLCNKNSSKTFGDSDTLEAISDRLTSIQGSGFSEGSDSLKAISVAQQSTQAGRSVSEQALTGFRSDGFLYRVIRDTRRKVEEGQINAKYSNNDVIELIRKAYEQLWVDLYALDRAPVRHRVNIAVTAATREYQLPPTVGALTELAKIDSATGQVEWEHIPEDQYSVNGPGFAIEGNVIRFTPKLWSSATLQVTFIPNGQMRPHEGECAYADGDTDDGQYVTLAATPSAGILDTRINAYGGYMLRVLGAFDSDDASVAAYDYVQERLIRDYNRTSRQADLATPLDPNPFEAAASGSVDHIVYEVVPVLGPVPETLLALIAAREILSNEGAAKRRATQEQEYTRQLRTVKMARKVMNARRTTAFEGNVRDNPRARGWPVTWYPSE